MRFNYQAIGANDFAPIVMLKLRGKNGWISVEAYADSGASFSIFGADRAEVLGIDFTKGILTYITVGDGGLLEVYLNKVRVEFAGRRFMATIGFSSRLGVRFNLLGRRDFFEKFRFCFDDLHRYITVTQLASKRHSAS